MKKIISLFFTVFCCCITGCDYDALRELSGGYRYYYDGGNMSMILQSDYDTRKSIYGKVIDYKYNEDYILVLQRPVYEEYVNELAGEIFETMPNGDQILYKDDKTRRTIADSILRNDSFYQKVFLNDINYWIIIIAEDSLVGPLTQGEYLNLRAKLSIPESIFIE